MRSVDGRSGEEVGGEVRDGLQEGEVAQMQEGEMSAVDRTRGMEGAGREREKGWSGGGESAWRFGEVRVAEREAYCPYRPAAESRSLMGPV